MSGYRKYVLIPYNKYVKQIEPIVNRLETKQLDYSGETDPFKLQPNADFSNIGECSGSIYEKDKNINKAENINEHVKTNNGAKDVKNNSGIINTNKLDTGVKQNEANVDTNFDTQSVSHDLDQKHESLNINTAETNLDKDNGAHDSDTNLNTTTSGVSDINSNKKSVEKSVVTDVSNQEPNAAGHSDITSNKRKRERSASPLIEKAKTSNVDNVEKHFDNRSTSPIGKSKTSIDGETEKRRSSRVPKYRVDSDYVYWLEIDKPKRRKKKTNLDDKTESAVVENDGT